jgi:hypothetical protein
MLRRIFGSKYESITGIRSKLYTEELRNIQLKENQIRERVACMGDTKNEYNILVLKPEQTRGSVVG